MANGEWRADRNMNGTNCNATERIAKEAYEREGWNVVHFGAPDFLLWRRTPRGRMEVAFAEVKVAGGELSPSQMVWLAALDGLRARVEIARVSHHGNIKLETPVYRSKDRRLMLLPTMVSARRRRMWHRAASGTPEPLESFLAGAKEEA